MIPKLSVPTLISVIHLLILRTVHLLETLKLVRFLSFFYLTILLKACSFFHFCHFYDLVLTNDSHVG